MCYSRFLGNRELSSVNPNPALDKAEPGRTFALMPQKQSVVLAVLLTASLFFIQCGGSSNRSGTSTTGISGTGTTSNPGGTMTSLHSSTTKCSTGKTRVKTHEVENHEQSPVPASERPSSRKRAPAHKLRYDCGGHADLRSDQRDHESRASICDRTSGKRVRRPVGGSGQPRRHRRARRDESAGGSCRDWNS
jgi:hypothetical protein